MNIKREPFGSAVRIGTWLHLGLVVFLLFQIFFPGGSYSLAKSLGLAIDWIVGVLYSRNYARTWPVQIFNVALGGMFANLFARCAAALVIGIFYFFSNVAGSASFAESLQKALSAAGGYVLWGALFGAIGAAYTLLRNKDILNGLQSLILFVTIASLWIAQYTYEPVSTELTPGLTPAVLNWIVAGFAVTIALYVPNKTDGLAIREFGTAALLTILGFIVSLAYRSFPDGASVPVHGFPFGVSFEGWEKLTILMNLLFWFNISYLLTCVRTIIMIRSYSRE
ncbi:MAG: hypothetical protein AB1750_10935 [Chloroflexota bacterium]